MEVMTPATSTDFNFDSACSSPYISAPSSPKRFGDFYYSAPTSPTRALAIYHDISSMNANSSSRGDEREGKPGKPKSKSDVDEDFEFDFSGHFEKTSRTAEELFDGGKIRPLKSLPAVHLGSELVDESVTRKNPVSNPRSPRSPIAQGKKMIRGAFSPRHRKEVDPFAVAVEQIRKGADKERGRERVLPSSSSNSSRRGTRSLSPLRVSESAWEEQQQQQLDITKPNSSNSNSKPSSSFSSSFSFSSFKGYRKWRLKDFLLFRSASEGRATDKDPLRKFAVLSRKNDDVKNDSFRSTESAVLVSCSKRRESISPHELHYTVNRAASEVLRKRTFLPYKQGLLGCLGFNPAVQGFGRGFNW